MWLNQMQEAFLNAAVAKGRGKLFNKVADAAARVKLGGQPKENIKLSFRTAQKLKAVGAI